MGRSTILIALLLTNSIAVAGQNDARATTAKEEDSTPAKEYSTIVRDLRRMIIDVEGATSKEEQKRLEEKYKGVDFGARFLALARKYPNDPAAFDSLCFLACRLFTKDSEKAVDILIRDHIQNEKLGEVCARMEGYSPKSGSSSEKLLRALIENSRHREVQARAHMSLARHLKEKAEMARNLKAGDEFAAKLQEYWQLDDDRVKQFKEADLDQFQKEQEKLWETIVEKYSDFKHHSDARTLGELAKAELFECRGNLDVGKLAPEIEGEDVDGAKFKLSDYRGKVVVVSFWGTWCGPCMAQLPHERSLVKRLDGKPFAFLGVNSDEGKDNLRNAAKNGDVTWRNWWDDGSTEGPNATKYNVQSWPTIYVVDHKGTIRFKDVGDKEMDAAVDSLIKEIEEEKTRSE